MLKFLLGEFHFIMDKHGMALELIRAKTIEELLSLIVFPVVQNFIQQMWGAQQEFIKNIRKLIQMKWMKVFFQYYGHKKEGEQMFDEEEVKKDKPIDFDDLSVEEIELMIKDHQEQIEILKNLLNQKKEKLDLAKSFFKKN